MSSRTGLHVAVVKGGRSAERQVSIISGRECAAALRRVGYKVSEVDAGNDLPKELVQLSQISYLMLCTVGMEKMDAFRAYLNG